MSNFVDFTPASHFGVPLTAFPPGFEWNNTSELIREALADLSIPWVRQYLLDSNPLRDAKILSDPSRLQQAMALEFRATTFKELSSGFDADMLHFRYNVPAFSIGDIGVGVSVEATAGIGASDVVFSQSDGFVHFAINSRTGAQINVIQRERLGTVDITYLRHRPDGMWSYAMCVFNANLFHLAVDSNHIDFRKLEVALVRSIVGGVLHQNRPLLKCTGYPYRIADNSGDHCMKSVFCSYLDTVPVMSISVFAKASWSFHFNNETLRHMQAWGMSERFGRLQINPPSNAPSLNWNVDDDVQVVLDISDAVDEIVGNDPDLPLGTLSAPQEPYSLFNPLDILNAPVVVNSQQQVQIVSSAAPDKNENNEQVTSTHVRLKKIAPAPSPLPNQIITLTEEERLEEARKAKIELRKAKKREAAARRYSKKTAERRRKNGT